MMTKQMSLVVLTMAFITSIIGYTVINYWLPGASSTFQLKGRSGEQLSTAASDWNMFQGNLGRNGYHASETKLTTATAPNVKEQWSLKTTAGSGISSQPVVARDVIYWGDWNGYEHATTRQGKPLWTTFVGKTVGQCRPTFTGGITNATTIATVPIKGTMTEVAFVDGGDANVYALNASTGKVLWHTSLGTLPDHFLWGGTAVYQGHVYTGVASWGDCPLVQGQMVELNAETGALEYTFNMVPNGCVGGGSWAAPTIDTATGILYDSTATRSATCASNETIPQGIIALRASDLSYVGSWQAPLNQNIADGDFGSTPMLFEATINGVARPMVGLLCKNGVYYAFDRRNISAGPLWKIKIGSLHINFKTHISSSATDGTRIYAASGPTMIKKQTCGGSLSALDPTTGTPLWRACLPWDVFASPTVVPGLVIVGSGTTLYVFDATTGKVLSTFEDASANAQFYGWGSASVSDGVIYAGTSGGTLHAFG